MDDKLAANRIFRDVVVVGASAGGLRAFIQVVCGLPVDLPASISVVIHRGARSATDWSSIVDRKTRLRVVEPASGEALSHGWIYIAPSDRHLVLREDRVFLDDGPKRHHTRPSVDPLFESAAKQYGPRVLGILLSGGGHDGTQGLIAIAASGGICVVQDPSDALHRSMPANALANDHVSGAVSAHEITGVIDSLARGLPYVARAKMAEM